MAFFDYFIEIIKLLAYLFIFAFLTKTDGTVIEALFGVNLAEIRRVGRNTIWSTKADEEYDKRSKKRQLEDERELVKKWGEDKQLIEVNLSIRGDNLGE